MGSHSCRVQEQEGFHTPLPTLFSPATGGLTLLFHTQPSPLEEKTAKKGMKSLCVHFLQPPKFAARLSAATIQGWQMEKERASGENGHLFRPAQRRERYGCV